MPQCPHLWDRDNNDSYFIVLLWEFNGLINFKWDKNAWHLVGTQRILAILLLLLLLLIVGRETKTEKISEVEPIDF